MIKEPYNLIYKIRGILMVPPFLFLVCVFYGETEQGNVIWPAGLLLFTFGVLIRVWSQMHIHYRLKIHKTLTMTGPYVYLRNPIYVANTIMLLGLTVLSELLWFLPVMLLWCILVYSFVVRREEAHLLGKYGLPYSEYLQNVPRWVPCFGEKRNVQLKTKRFFWPSIIAELHCLLWLIPFIGKELFSSIH